MKRRNGGGVFKHPKKQTHQNIQEFWAAHRHNWKGRGQKRAIHKKKLKRRKTADWGPKTLKEKTESIRSASQQWREKKIYKLDPLGIVRGKTSGNFSMGAQAKKRGKCTNANMVARWNLSGDHRARERRPECAVQGTNWVPKKRQNVVKESEWIAISHHVLTKSGTRGTRTQPFDTRARLKIGEGNFAQQRPEKEKRT